MAGTVTLSISPTQYLVSFGGADEVVVSLACVSDASAGTIPDQDLGSTEGLAGLKAYELDEVITEPDSVAPPTTAYRVKIVEKSTSRKLFIGTARDVGAGAKAESQGGYEHLGYYPSIDSEPTVSFVADDGATEAAANVGNSKELTLKLRFKKRNQR